MDYSVYRLNLDVKTNRSQALLKVFKGDTAVRLVCMLTDGGRVFQLKDGNVATITLTTPGRSEPITHACYIRDNSIVYAFTQETTKLSDDDTTELSDDETTELGDDYSSGVIEAQLNVYGGIVEYDEEGKPIYPQTIATPKFSIEVSAAANKPTDPIFAGINASVGVVLGAAAMEYAREQAEEAREKNETVRQESYEKVIDTANEAKDIADTASSNASTALLASEEAKTEAGKAVAMFDSVGLEYNKQTGYLDFVYTKDGKEERKPVDHPLESAIVNIEERLNEDDGYIYLDFYTHKSDNEVAFSVKLDDIFEGFVKSQADINNACKVYGISYSGKNVLFPLDSIKYPFFNGSLVQRGSDGSIYLPSDSLDPRCAASVNICEVNLLVAENYTDNKFTEAKKDITDLDKRIEQLESASLKFTEYSDVTDAVPVPENAAKYALVDKVGGMNYKRRNPDNLFPSYIGDQIPKNAGETLTTDGVSVTLNFDYSITLNGTSNGFFLLFSEGSFYSQNGHTFSFGTKLPEGTVLAYDTLTFTDEETGEEWWDTQRDDISSGEVTINVTNFSTLAMEFPHNAVFNNITLYPTYSKSRDAVPYFLEVFHGTDVTEFVSEAANGTLVDRIDIPEAVKNRLPEHFEFGDGIDKDVCNYLNLESETVHGLVARMELNGDEPGWKASTNVGSGVTRLQFNYYLLGVPLAWLKINESGKQDTSAVTPAKCNRYESISPSNTVSGIKGIAFSPTTFFVHDPYFTLANFASEADILEAWKAHLKENPLTVVYQVAEPVTENVSDIIGDTFNRLVVSPLGKIKPISEYNTAAPITVSFVEAKGVYV